jgi:hypothetical protein
MTYDNRDDAYWGDDEPYTPAQNAPRINNGRFSLRLVTLAVSAMCGLAAATGIALVFGGSLASLAAMGLSGFVVSNYSICWWRDNPIFVKHLKDVPIPKNQNGPVPMTYSEEYGSRVMGKMGKVNKGHSLGGENIKNNAPAKPSQTEIDKKIAKIALIAFGFGRRRFQQSNTTYQSTKGPFPRTRLPRTRHR